MRSQQDFNYPIVPHVASPSCSTRNRRIADLTEGRV